MPSGTPYSPEEDAIIMKYRHVSHGLKLAGMELPRRTLLSIRSRRELLLNKILPAKLPTNERNRLKRTITKCAKKSRKKWSKKEKKFLLNSNLSRMEQANKLGRSFESVCRAVYKLNKQSKEREKK